MLAARSAPTPGFRGRVGVYELLNVSDTIREMIVARASHHELRAVAIEEGMRTMQAQAFELVVDGMTTVEDVVRSVFVLGADMGEASQLELPAGRSRLARAPERIRKAAETPAAQEDGGQARSDSHGRDIIGPSRICPR
ncbi:MAG: hypothetical protein V9F03_04725 [Microthrixaceae bacterium]